MAIISSIQKRAYILVFIIALALISFLFLDFSSLGQSFGNKTYVGKVNGNEMDIQEFNKIIDEKETLYLNSTGKANLSEAEKNSIRSEVWSNNFVKPALMKRLKDNGFSITPSELVEITTGTNISPALRQARIFLDNNGQYDAMKFRNFINTLNQDDPNMPRGTRKKQWLEYEDQIKEVRIANKFNNLINNSQYAPKWMVDYEEGMINVNSDISYVSQPYSSIPDDKIKVDESEMKDYFEKNKNKYRKYPESVLISHTSFQLKPSTADSTAIFEEFTKKVSEMRSTDNDTTFFKINGDNSFDPKFYTFADLRTKGRVDDIMSAAPNTILGPYIEGDNVKAIKILRKRMLADSVQVKAITISFKDVANNQEGINARWKVVDSVFRILDTLNGNFEQVAQTFSADRGQSEAVWLNSQMKDINPEIFTYGSTQKYFKSPSNAEGVVRIFKVLQFPATKLGVQLGEISSPFVPSSETQNEIYNTAISYKEKCTDEASMKKLAESYPTALNLRTNATADLMNLDGIGGNAREAIRWAFSTEEDNVSNIFQVGSNYVICGVEARMKNEEPKFEDVKNLVKIDFMNEKRYQMIADNMKGKTLDQVAAANNTTVATASDFGYNNAALNNVQEPSVVAATKYMKVGQVSNPIKGNNGVYLVKVDKSNKKELEASDKLNIKMNLNRTIKNMYGVLEAMIEKLGIDDNRINMF